MVGLGLAMGVLILAEPSVVSLRDSLEPDHALYKDFGQEYLLARAIADGVDPYIPMRDLAARYLAPLGYLDKPYPTPHPPSVGVLFLPFLLVDYPSAVRIWFGIQLTCLVCGLGLVIREARLAVRLRWAPVIGFALLGWAPVVVDLGLGQLTMALFALLVAAQVALGRDRGVLGGGLLGLALLVKPIAWPWLLPLLWLRQWSAVLTTLTVVVLGFAIPSLRIGFGASFEYLTHVLPSVSALYAIEPTNISLWTVGPRLFGGTVGGSPNGGPPLVASPEAARLVGFGVPLLVLALSAVWLRSRPPLRTALGVMTCVSILVNPISWQYYLVLLLLPAAQVIHWLHVRGYPVTQTIIALVVAVALDLTSGEWRDLALLVSTPWIGADQRLPSVASLLLLGPSLGAGALGLLLASLPPNTGSESIAADQFL